VDLMVQIGSPRSIAVALQRIGRSGHWVGARPKARFMVTTRDELVEAAALLGAIGRGELEKIAIPEHPLDVLAQQVVAAAACESWDEDELYGLVKRARPYGELPRADFDAIIGMLSEGIATSRGRSGALLHRDQVNHRVKGRRGARLAAITSGGAIPENANYAVVAEPDNRTVGTVDEDFAVESMAGDVFLLGTQSWRIRRVEKGRVRVEDAHGAVPSVPFWLGESPGRSAELSAAVSRLREEVRDGCWKPQASGVDEAGAGQLVAYLAAGAAALGAMPTGACVVAERFFDEAGGMQLVLHAPFGARVNRAWGLALRKRFCRTFNFELQAAATDNGIVISLSEQHAFPLELVFEFLKPQTLEDVLTQALLPAPMFGARWRWNATRALAVLRFAGGRRVPPPIQRMRSDDLLAAVFPDQVACAENLSGPIRIPEHPLVQETVGDCLHEAMDIDTLREVIEGIRSGRIEARAIETTAASPLSHEILNANPYAFLDDAPLEERRARAVQLRSTLGEHAGPGSVLDAGVIDAVTAESWPLVRDADELHDALLTLMVMPPERAHEHWYRDLAAAGRAFQVERGGRSFWAAEERRALAGDVLETVRGWMESIGPVTVGELAGRIAFEADDVNQALHNLEAQGQVFQGRFRPGAKELEWCNRRIFHQFLCRWQHREAHARLHGADGLLSVIRQLQGFELAAVAWESEIFPQRIVEYSPELLDELCLSGEVAWGRLSPHPALEGEGRRVRPTRIAPITFFLREDAGWLAVPVEQAPEGLSHAARDVMAVLERQGASFFTDLAREARRLPSEVEDALWELVAGGLVTADGFENLRALIDPKRRRGEGRARQARPRNAAGRWAKMPRVEPAADRTVKLAEQLLNRWGVLFRDVLGKEALAPPWRELLPVLRKMEAQGTLRGGRFVDGFTGEQYARPEALDLLRRIRREASAEFPAAVGLTDPLNWTALIPRLALV
jgi:ATP-dependent helicase Lhr and Lhr-like helicase